MAKNNNMLSRSGMKVNIWHLFKTHWFGKTAISKLRRSKSALLVVVLLASSAAALTSLGVWRAVRATPSPASGTVAASPANVASPVTVDAPLTKLREYVYASGGRLVTSEEKSCVPTLNPVSASSPQGGGTGSSSVSTASGCTWTATSNASWITVTAPTSGVGAGAVNYSVAANGGAQRVGTITVNGQAFTVTQAPNQATCSYTLNTSGVSVSEQAGSGSFTLTTGGGCPWTAVSNATSWLTVTSAASGAGPATISYSVAANNGPQRVGAITVGGQNFNVTQAPNQASCTFALSPSSWLYGTGGGGGSFSVTTGAGCRWNAANNDGWITITGGGTGIGSGTVSFNVQANNGGSRTGSIWVGGQAFTITQCGYVVSPTSNTFYQYGGSDTIQVSAAAGCSWSATTDANWIHISSGASGTGSGNILYWVEEYDDIMATRSGNVWVEGREVSIYQSGNMCCSEPPFCVPCQGALDASTTGGNPRGLTARYFDNVTLSGQPALQRTDAIINFDWTGNTPDKLLPAGGFSTRWNGQLAASSSEAYTFYLYSEGGARLWVNNQLVIDRWQPSSEPYTRSAPVELKADAKAGVRVEYYNAGGKAAIHLLWSSASTPKRIIPQRYLYPEAATNGASPTDTIKQSGMLLPPGSDAGPKATWPQPNAPGRWLARPLCRAGLVLLIACGVLALLLRIDWRQVRGRYAMAAVCPGVVSRMRDRIVWLGSVMRLGLRFLRSWGVSAVKWMWGFLAPYLRFLRLYVASAAPRLTRLVALLFAHRPGLLPERVRNIIRQALSSWRSSGVARLKPLLRRALVVALIVRLAAPLTPAEAEGIGGAMKESWREISAYAKAMVNRPTTGGTSHHHARVEASKPSTRVAFASMQSQNVASLQVSPTQLNMYVGENYTLSPVPLDSGGNVVQGAGMQWSSANTAIATVTSFGQVRAVAAGNTSVQAQSGNATVQIPVQVLSGARSLQSRAASMAQQSPVPINSDGTVPDPDPEPVSDSLATNFRNAVGHPRFSPIKRSGSTSVQLGSDNYQFSVPVASVGGRGISEGVAMSFNSRVWNNDNGTMTFNYVAAFPAPGWSMGYGKIIRNYNATATGDKTGIGSANSPGDYLLVAAGGTRTRLAATYDSSSGRWYHLSDDGSFLKFDPASGEMRHPDGSRMIYSNVNGILQPTAIINTNGSAITMSYRDYCEGAGCQRVFRFHTAFNAIRDTLGRYLTFHYYGDAGYPADPNNGRPAGTLAAIKAPDMQGVQQEVIRVEYQAITLQYNFGGATVNAPSSGSQIQVVKRIYYPQTGKGFLFLDYSTYGMPRKISSRIKMTGPGGAITDGAEIAYTTYDYTTIDPNDPYGRNQGSGSLNDSPQFAKRKVWWQGKTDATGAPTNDPTEYDYSRTVDSSTETDTIKNVGKNVDEITVTGTDSAQLSFGKVISVEQRDDTTGATLSKRTYTYTTGPDGESEIAQVESIVDGAGTLVSFAYDHYGRVADKSEYGYKQASGYNVYRRIHNDYINSSNYINARFLRLANRVSIYDASNNLLSKTETTYDDYSSMGGMQNYGLSADQYPPNHDATYDQNNTLRGNATAVTTFSQLSPSEVSTTRHAKYDIFGNVVQAEVSCCVVKSFDFSGVTAYSEPDSVTSGDTGGFNLQTTYQHNYFTGLLEQESNPDGLLTTYGYDKALRLNQVTNNATGAVALTQFDQDNYGNDLLTYLSKVTYDDQGTQKIITSRQWFDGLGAVIQAGTGAGSAPNSYDMTATIYDSWGRVLKRSNPYAGDASGNPQSGVTRFWTTNTYDLLSRVKQVTLPDQQTIKTDYFGATTTSGATVVTTDPVGRKRKIEADGFGRPVKATEQNPANGNLEWETSYSYDARDNLIQTNQGGQLRTFAYDAKGRLTRETTPEAGQVTYAYTDFDAVSSSTDARQVVTTYTYGDLNMLTGVSYDTTHAAGVAATAPVSITYKTTSPGKGQVEKVTDGVTESAGSETYSYDSVGRLQSCTRMIDGISYQKQYEYNAVGQMTLMIYPSGKRVNVGRDDRGRLADLKKVDDSGATQETYLSGVTYRADDLISSQNLGDSTTENFGYSNDRLQLTSQTATKGGTTLLSLNYGYGAGAGQMGSGTTAGNSGQLVSVSGTVNGQGRNQAFTYDNVGRLVTATGWGAWARRFGYDRFGNRTAVWDAVSGGNQLQNTVIAQSGGMTTNRIASLNGTNFSYDANGNVTGDGARTYTYDARNQMVSVSAASGGESYAYDAGRHRVKKVVGGVVTHYVWGEDNNVLAEYERGGAATPATGTRYYHQDRFSTRIITGVAGNVVGTTDQLPFGEEFTSTGQSEKHKFASYERDDSGLDLAVHRHYNSAIGRFMQPDPMGIRAANLSNPQSLNRYAYVTNDAINKVDPLGLFEEEEFDYEEDYFDGGGDGGGGGGWFCSGCNGVPGEGDIKWFDSYGDVPDGYVEYGGTTAVGHGNDLDYILGPNGEIKLDILPLTPDNTINIDSSEQELNDFAKGVIHQTGGELAAVDPYLEGMAKAVLMLFGGPFAEEAAITDLTIEGAGVAAEGTATAEQGGLNLFKWNDATSTTETGWKEGDHFLYLPNQGSTKANWIQNSSRLREEMGKGNPIFDSFRDAATGEQIPTRGFLNAERNLLESHGWNYNPQTGAYHPPGAH